MAHYPGYFLHSFSLGYSDLSDTSIIHPESYIRNRPNFRSGFGGNYSRPNAGFRKTDPRSVRSASLERFQAHTPEQQPTPSRNTTFSTATSNGPIHSAFSPTPVQIMSPRTSVTLQSTPLRNSIHCLSPSHLFTPTVVWLEKTERERQSDQKLLQLIQQLPVDRRNSVGLILLRLGITSTNETQQSSAGGLEFRLREALQLVPPAEVNEAHNRHGRTNGTTESNGAGSCSTYSDNHNGPQPDKPTRKSDSHPNDPRMTQSCYQPRTQQDFSTELENMLALNGQTKTPINGHLPDSLLTASSTSIESNSDLEQPQQSKTTAGNGYSETKPSVTTVLRHLARRLAVRIAFKRERLAYVQQRVAKNTTEEKWLRNKLNEIFTLSEHSCGTQPPYLRSDSMFQLLDGCDSANGQVVARFDRWHHNTISVIQLLCQLARRLACLDARLISFSKHMQNCTENEWMNGNNQGSNDSPYSLELVNRQRIDLQMKIREAQDLRAGLENCRLRLLESIPPGLQVEAPTSLISNEVSASYRPSSTSDSHPEASSSSDPSQLPGSKCDGGRTSIFLRDRVAIQMQNSLDWLVKFHILDTHIRVDQDLCDSISDDLRLEMNY
ncbi:hypothetical protein PHET_01000 [Paragonimus heterotremus]|uniref:Uncharacterized protein n=1 Tax=Paragonimus heterotremus TaxID=100268 RepID=A0A8J4TS33_9TREM|nr:hypothetical protein PHET_01000 [Paragonimus heterotremus]